MSEQPATAMGHGVKQRDLIRMTPEEVDAFLHEKHTMTMCCMNADGTIHATGMWYGFLEGAVAVETKAKSQKVANLRRNPNLTMLFETGPVYEELRGVSLVGTAEIIDDPSRMWELGVSVFERHIGPYNESMAPGVQAMLNKRVVVKMNVNKVVSWDHRKLAIGR
jgi:PPOX class probable F420-dependent enzyme